MATTAVKRSVYAALLLAAAGCMGAADEPKTEVKEGASIGCAHSPCTTGGPLNASCGMYGCVADICGFDSYCCGIAWDSTCVSEMANCPRRCDCSQVQTSGTAFYPDASRCTVTVCGGDAYCCDTYWDNVCVAETYLPNYQPYCNPVCQ